MGEKPAHICCQKQNVLGVWDGNAVKLGYDDHYTTIDAVKFIQLKNKNQTNKKRSEMSLWV